MSPVGYECGRPCHMIFVSVNDSEREPDEASIRQLMARSMLIKPPLMPTFWPANSVDRLILRFPRQIRPQLVTVMVQSWNRYSSGSGAAGARGYAHGAASVCARLKCNDRQYGEEQAPSCAPALHDGNRGSHSSDRNGIHLEMCPTNKRAGSDEGTCATNQPHGDSRRRNLGFLRDFQLQRVLSSLSLSFGRRISTGAKEFWWRST